jgi:hypothetical protein
MSLAASLYHRAVTVWKKSTLDEVRIQFCFGKQLYGLRKCYVYQGTTLVGP